MAWTVDAHTSSPVGRKFMAVAELTAADTSKDFVVGTDGISAQAVEIVMLRINWNTTADPGTRVPQISVIDGANTYIVDQPPSGSTIADNEVDTGQFFYISGNATISVGTAGDVFSGRPPIFALSGQTIRIEESAGIAAGDTMEIFMILEVF